MLTRILIVSCLIHSFNCARILGFFFVPSISHQVIYQSVWRELANRGHDVTIFSPNILNNITNDNLIQNDMGFSYEFIRKYPLENLMKKEFSLPKIMINIYEWSNNVIEYEFRHPIVQSLLNQTDEFDLVLIENLNPILYGFADKFKAPVVGISSLGVMLNTHDAVGNPSHPIVSPDIFMSFSGKPTFLQRVHSTLYNLWYRLMYHYYFLPQCDSIARKYFGQKMRYLGDLEKEVSLLLLNVNPILHPVRPNVPKIIELGQMHIKPKKPLPQDLQEFLDSSTEGVIYFSLGSNVKSANLTETVRNTIINALSELPYKVLWKWESDYLPNQPRNVITRKWFPQQDLLGHPNIKAFVTQGGLQSMEEAIVNGVPLIGMPFFADQPLNVAKMVQMEIAKAIDYNTMTKDELKHVIIEVAVNDKYRRNVQKFQNLLNDQPMTGIEKAIWWIEYVIRHNGAPHLRSTAVDLAWYEYFLVDVVLFILSINVVCIYAIYLFVQLVKKFVKSVKIVQKHNKQL